MIEYEGVLVSASSELGKAIKEKQHGLAKRIFAETSQRYCKLYPEADRLWMANWRLVQDSKCK